MNELRYFTVDSIERKTGRLLHGNIVATSARNAMIFEKMYFGGPHFIVLRAYPKEMENNQIVVIKEINL